MFQKHICAYLLFVIAFIPMKAFSQTGYAPTYLPPTSVIAPKSYSIFLEGSMFSKTGNFTTESETIELTEGQAMSMSDGLVKLRYAFGNRFMMTGLVTGRQVTSNNGTNEVSNSGLESYGLEFRYALPRKKKWSFSLEGIVSQTAYTNEEFAPGQAPTDQIVLGDSGTTVSLGGHLAYNISRYHFMTLSLAYVMPPSQISKEIRYDLHTAFAYKRLGMQVGVKGIYSMKTDEYAGDPSQKPSQSTGIVTQFNSINRDVVEPYVAVNFAFKRLTLGVFGETTYFGTNTDQGNRLGARIVYYSDGVSAEQRKVNKFKEYLVEASVLKISPRGKFVKIDKGVSSDIRVGMRIDIYESDFLGGNILIASGLVHEVSASQAIVKIQKTYKKIPIRKGHYARGY